MKKSYFANTIEGALLRARRELGDETLLLDSRRAPAEERHLGAYEVVVEAPEEKGAPWEELNRVAAELAELRVEIKRLQKSGPLAGPPDELIQELAKESGALTARKVFGQMFSVAQPGAGVPRVIAVVGPPGAGKTSLLVKLATHYSIEQHRCAALLSADCFRIGAADQLRCYAAILGLPFYSAETAATLTLNLDELKGKGKDIVFVDTPGLSPREMETGTDLAAVLAANSDVETHLVLSAAGRTADLLDAVERWSIFHPQRLAFTKLDETSAYGPMFAVAARSGLPVSFLTNGQRIPEDFEFASERRVLDLLLGEEPISRAAAA
jgi:flagellar biosynthesis GTPase FlhF